MDYRYFIATSEDWARKATLALSELQKSRAARHAFRTAHGADALYMRGQFLCGLGWIADEKRKGWLPADLIPNGGDNYIAHKPDKRTKIGKQAATAIAAFNRSRQSFSTLLLKELPREFDVSAFEDRYIYQSVAGYCKKQLVFKIPIPSAPAQPSQDVEALPVPTGLKEIKKSEFVALTED